MTTQKKEVVTITKNIVKMIANRGLVKKEDTEEICNTLMSSTPEDLTFRFPLSDGSGQTFAFKIVPQDISAINKGSGLMGFLSTSEPVIIVANGVSKRALNDAKKFPNCQMFTKGELMIDKLESDLVPKHKLLSAAQAKEFLTTARLKPEQMPSILSNDPIAKYYGAKPGDIFRITRPNTATGFANTYRYVIPMSHP